MPSHKKHNGILKVPCRTLELHLTAGPLTGVGSPGSPTGATLAGGHTSASAIVGSSSLDLRGIVSRSPGSALLPFLREGSPTKVDYRNKGTLILSALLEDLGLHQSWKHPS